jgi:hypothetical protein
MVSDKKIFMEISHRVLDGPLQKMCPMIPTFNQDVRQAKNRKRGDEIEKKIFSETTEPISTKFCRNDPWVVPFQKCVRHFRPPTKMAATAELNLHMTLWEISITISLSETICSIITKC